MGVIARNYKGEVLFSASRRVRGLWLPVIAECKAMVLAVKLAKRFGLKKVILETDCEEVASRLTKGMIYFTDLDSILEDVIVVALALIFLIGHMLKEMETLSPII